MQDDFVVTHVGWYWFCPIQMDDRDSFAPSVQATFFWLEPLFSFCAALDTARIYIQTLYDPEYEPMFAFRVQEVPEEPLPWWKKPLLYLP